MYDPSAQQEMLALLHADALPLVEVKNIIESLNEQDKLYLSSLERVKETLYNYGKMHIQPPADLFERINAKILAEDPIIATHKSSTIHHSPIFKKRKIKNTLALGGLSLGLCAASILTFLVFHIGHNNNSISQIHQTNGPSVDDFNFNDTSLNNSSTTDIHNKQAARMCLIQLGYPIPVVNNIISVSYSQQNTVILFRTSTPNTKSRVLIISVPSRCLLFPNPSYPHYEHIYTQ